MVFTFVRLSKASMSVVLLLFLFAQVHGDTTLTAKVSSSWSRSCSAWNNCHCQLFVQFTTPPAAIDYPSNGSLCPMSWTLTKPGTSASLITYWYDAYYFSDKNSSYGYASGITTAAVTPLLINGVSRCQNTTPSDTYHVVDQSLSLEEVSYRDYEAEDIYVLLSIIVPTIVLFWMLALIIFILWVKHNNVRLMFWKRFCYMPLLLVKSISWLFGQQTPSPTNGRYENGQPSATNKNAQQSETGVPVPVMAPSSIEMSTAIRPSSVPVPVSVSLQQHTVPVSMVSMNGMYHAVTGPVNHFTTPPQQPIQHIPTIPTIPTIPPVTAQAAQAAGGSTVPQAILININGVPTLAYIISPVAGAAPLPVDVSPPVGATHRRTPAWIGDTDIRVPL
eukprot:GILK01007769.1.p1 GENE.GILK01007769.1~~GILK01007769.1.p1  ORF type:complete len:390 (+),score=27.05 GILK01007769.1:178-1347(+)